MLARRAYDAFERVGRPSDDDDAKIYEAGNINYVMPLNSAGDRLPMIQVSTVLKNVTEAERKHWSEGS